MKNALRIIFSRYKPGSLICAEVRVDTLLSFHNLV